MVYATQIVWDMRFHAGKKKPQMRVRVPDEVVNETEGMPSWDQHDHIKKWLEREYGLPVVAFLLVREGSE